MNSQDKIFYSLFAMFVITLCGAIYIASNDKSECGGDMRLHTDAQTGCQYLSKGNGLTPRLDREGKHLGCK